ncbi:MAG: hypothetical protein ACYDBQ_10400 [Thermoplasmatota archaeon]
MTAGPRARDELGVSSVLSAILMFGLFAVVMVRVQAAYVPQWDLERESTFMTAAGNQMATIEKDLTRIGLGSPTPVADAVTLSAPSGLTWFAGPSPPASLSFLPSSGQAFSLTSPNLNVATVNGAPLYVLGESWSAVGSGAAANQIADVAHLRLRLDNPTANPGTLAFMVRDANGKCAGALNITASVQAGASFDILTQVYGPTTPPSAVCPGSPAGTPLTQEDTDWKKQLVPAFFFVDLAEPALQFSPLFANAVTPTSFTLSQSGIQAEYTAVYDTVSSGGTTRVGAGGISIPNYSLTLPAGVLRFSKVNNRFPSQNYSFEYGAMILEQPEGAVMASPPPLTIFSTSTLSVLSWGYAGATGPSATRIGTPATVHLTPGAVHTVIGSAHAITIGLTTSHAALWQSYLASKMAAAGVQSGSPGLLCLILACPPSYTLSTTGNTVTLSLVGSTALLDNSSPHVQLTLQEADVAVAI